MKYLKLYEENNNIDLDIKSKVWDNLSDEELNEYLKFFGKRFDNFNNDKYYMENKDMWIYLSYRVNGELKALCDMGFYSDGDEYCKGEHFFINYICTDIKRQGIGEKMLKYLIDDTYPNISFACFVKKSNIPSIKLFEKMGFQIVGEQEFEDQDVKSYVMNLVR